MGDPFSIVIICKNEAAGITRVLDNIRNLTDDIVVYDSGSTDGTIAILRSFGVHLHQGEWLGFGNTKHKAVTMARYDWILSLDADEAPDETLQQTLKNISLASQDIAYRISFKNHLGSKILKWGEWGGDKHIRLFNRRLVNWDSAPVHEQLVIPETVKIKTLKGNINHYTMNDVVEYSNKMVQYALLNADKYFQQGKTSTRFKRYINPAFTFIKHYIFQLGFLDGWEGLVSARMTSFYTFLKYTRLHELNSKEKKADCAPNL